VTPGPHVRPHNVFVELAALLQDATAQDLRQTRTSTMMGTASGWGQSSRPQPPHWTRGPGQRCRDHRKALGSTNSHLPVTIVPKAIRAPSLRRLCQEHPALDAAGRSRRHLRPETCPRIARGCATKLLSPTSPVTLIPPACRTRDNSGASSHTFARTRALSRSSRWRCSPSCPIGVVVMRSWCAATD
jgi:hypothetical protein